MFELDAEIKKGTISDRRFKGMEFEIAIGVERETNILMPCSTPRCENPAIRNSHTLQKGGVLRYLAEDTGKVYQTKTTPFTKGDRLKELSAKSASTFPGFCTTCEVSEFSHVENFDVPLTYDTALPLLWRSLCFVKFRRAQEVKLRGLMVLKPNLYKIVSDHEDPATGLATMLSFKNSIYSYRIARKWTTTLERALKNGGQISIIAVSVPDLPFAGAGLIPIAVDFNREADENLFRFDREVSSLAYTTILIEGIPNLIFAMRNMDTRAKLFCKSMLSMELDLLSAYLPQIVIGGSDTVFVSKKYWDDHASLSDKKIFSHAQAMRYPQMAYPSWGGMTKVKIDGVLHVH